MEILSALRTGVLTPARLGALGLALLVALAGVGGTARAQSFSEEAVKAAYLLRFASYVNWPEETGNHTPFVIMVLGARGVGQQLQVLSKGHEIDGRRVEVREVRSIREVNRPQILYLGAGRAEELSFLTAERTGEAALLVTDEEDGLNRGSMLNFVTLDHRVRFEVSLTAAERAHLKISADLLAVAVRVLGGRRQTRDICMPAIEDVSGCSISVAHGTAFPIERSALAGSETPG